MAGRVNYDFTDESAIVTGSTKGIGRGIAKTLVEVGGDVLLNSRTGSDVEDTVTRLQGVAEGDVDVVGVAADVGDPEGVQRIVDTAVDECGTIDLLVNNAAVWPQEPSMVEADLGDLDYTINVNVRAQFHAAKLIAEHMISEDVKGASSTSRARPGTGERVDAACTGFRRLRSTVSRGEWHTISRITALG